MISYFINYVDCWLVLKFWDLMEYSFISFEKKESSLSSSLSGESYSAILPVSSHTNNSSNSLTFKWSNHIYKIRAVCVFLTITKDQHKVTINHRMDSVSYCDNCPIFEFLTNYLLYHTICCRVHRCCCFVQYQNAAFLQQSPSKTEQLSLPHAPIFSIFNHCKTILLHVTYILTYYKFSSPYRYN